MTVVSIPVYDFLKIAACRIPNLAGIKFTFEDLEDLEDLEDFKPCLDFEGGKYDLLIGRDEQLLWSFSIGSRGAVGSTYNFAAPIYQQVIAAFDAGKLQTAEKLQSLAVTMIDTLIAGGPSPIATFKWFMKRLGVDCGPARLPLQPPTKEQIDMLEIKLNEIGIFEAVGCSKTV